MHRSKFWAVFMLILGSRLPISGQEFKLLDHPFQIHGFASQGFIYSGNNNWLTVHSSHGSGAFTDFGVTVSTVVNDKFRVGAQLYDRNLGNLGEWHPTLDWAVADYKFDSRFGIRGGKVKTKLGLHNDTQDLEFLSPFALLPQSVYPTDLRDTTIAHLGGDLYGRGLLGRQWGALSYTLYAGQRRDSIYSGYPYVLTQFDIRMKAYGGLQYGADLRWNTPVKGLLVGVSRMNEEISARGTTSIYGDPSAGRIPYSEWSRADWTNQFYGQYTVGKLNLEGEYRRYLRDQMIYDGTSEAVIDVRGWYIAGSYRVQKHLQLGSYYSHYVVNYLLKGQLSFLQPVPSDTDSPANHVYDKVVSARVDLTRWWDAKIEGHFMDGYGNAPYPNGFYPQLNPNGFKPTTNVLVLKTGVYF
jgi:hypothetical protein